jgi:hypothetical protein
MQLMPVLASDADNFDMTGTIIHATHPIGMIGGSMDVNVPADFPYPNFVCEMIPPVSRWGTTYYATNIVPPPGESNKDVARYLFISSQSAQTIFRSACGGTKQVECTIDNQYGIYWDELEGAQKFFSSAPFLLVSYSNSGTYPDGSNGSIEPAEVAINPVEHFSKSVTFVTLPATVGSSSPYNSSANIIWNVNDAENTTLDGAAITRFSAQCIDDSFEIIIDPHLSLGVHTVVSDSGVGVYLFSFGDNGTYAWSSPDSIANFNSSDTIPPTVETSSMCYEAFIHVADSGLLPNDTPQSGLNEIVVDSIYNMNYQPDADFIAGSGADTSGYSISVSDLAFPAIAVVEVFDVAGNETTITNSYTPDYDSIKPAIQNLGVWINGQPNVAFDTIFNEGQTPFDLSILHLKYGNVGFTLFDSTGGPLDLSPIPVGRYRIVEITFEATQKTLVVDSIVYGNSCDTQAVAVIGSGGADDFLVTSQTWPDEPLGNCYPESVEIENLSPDTITIDSVWWSDTVHFKAVSTLPVTVPPAPASVPFVIYYCPDSSSIAMHNSTEGHWTSKQVDSSDGNESPRFDSLVGWAPAPSGVSEENAPSLTATILPMNDGQSLEIILPSDASGPVNFQLVNVLGESVLRETLSTGTQTVDASGLPRGVYFYRLTSGQMSQSGKVVLGE